MLIAIENSVFDARPKRFLKFWLIARIIAAEKSVSAYLGNFASATLGAGDFTIAVSPTTETIPPGHMAVYTLTLSSTTGFQGTINLTWSGGAD